MLFASDKIHMRYFQKRKRESVEKKRRKIIKSKRQPSLRNERERESMKRKKLQTRLSVSKTTILTSRVNLQIVSLHTNRLKKNWKLIYEISYHKLHLSDMIKWRTTVKRFIKMPFCCWCGGKWFPVWSADDDGVARVRAQKCAPILIFLSQYVFSTDELCHVYATHKIIANIIIIMSNW